MNQANEEVVLRFIDEASGECRFQDLGGQTGGSEPLRTRWLRFGRADAPVQVLAFHMLGLCAESFSRFSDHLTTKHPRVAIHAFDQRGHASANCQIPRGFSDWVRDGLCGLQRLRGASLHLIGSSMGGAVAASVASETSLSVQSLTLIATPVRGVPSFAERGCAVADGRWDDVLSTTMERWFGSETHDLAREFARKSICQMSFEGWDASWHALAQFGGFESLQKCLPRTCCIAFNDDISTPPSHLDDIASQLREAGTKVERVNISSGGHAGLLVKPEDVAEHFGKFLLAS